MYKQIWMEFIFCPLLQNTVWYFKLTESKFLRFKSVIIFHNFQLPLGI